MYKVLWIMAGGAIGAVLRYSLSGIVNSNNPVFPYGTVLVNIFGCFLIGCIGGIAENYSISDNMRAFVLIGAIGAFTTFSTYMFESLKLFQSGEVKLAVMNIMLSNIMGFVFAYVGYSITK